MSCQTQQEKLTYVILQCLDQVVILVIVDHVKRIESSVGYHFLGLILVILQVIQNGICIMESD